MAAANPDRTALCRADGGLAMETEAHGNRRGKSLGTKVRRQEPNPAAGPARAAGKRLETLSMRLQDTTRPRRYRRPAEAGTGEPGLYDSVGLLAQRRCREERGSRLVTRRKQLIVIST